MYKMAAVFFSLALVGCGGALKDRTAVVDTTLPNGTQAIAGDMMDNMMVTDMNTYDASAIERAADNLEAMADNVADSGAAGPLPPYRAPDYPSMMDDSSDATAPETDERSRPDLEPMMNEG